MRYDYDAAVIGLGPAGMAVSIMGSEMGLKIAAIEKNKIGGECMNIGCIPSKALLRYSKRFYSSSKFLNSDSSSPENCTIFDDMQKHIDFIRDKKTLNMFDKTDLYLGENATFKDRHTLIVGDKTISANKIFICTGSAPFVPPIKGIEDIDILTNENIFSIDRLPKSMIILGGGAIGCEMAQAFSRLGTTITIAHMDPNLLYGKNKNSKNIMEDELIAEGIRVINSVKATEIKKENNVIRLYLDNNEILEGERILIAAGRKFDFDKLQLDNAQVKYEKTGIIVDPFLRTTAKNIYAPGDCNGHFLLSHAAMHQGMMALINSMTPSLFKKDFRKFIVPWTVFTEPAVSLAGMSEYELKEKKIKYEVISMKYADYGAAIAEEIPVGSVDIYTNTFGRIFGARIIGEGSGEMINEIALCIQKNIRMYNLLFLQHSFPTMSFLIKRAAEQWAMNRMNSSLIKKMAKWAFRRFY
ncbi:MAG: pyridine nucleotide-disulfide oxidoreductase [Candidatus Muiribacterium halophilum]|uniref:Pyridine nucleotide-disulfide oxidoreductase n=1 Tax=Muiribacterium halophilum TaxID=2053465 RepID=A0A2N5ZDF9_MUIH1|nr:MAG: pyridine nucleotide-disulfide oxidoreductase [Candidatus Muirbacterium halophilum]